MLELIKKIDIENEGPYEAASHALNLAGEGSESYFISDLAAWATNEDSMLESHTVFQNKDYDIFYDVHSFREEGIDCFRRYFYIFKRNIHWEEPKVNTPTWIKKILKKSKFDSVEA